MKRILSEARILNIIRSRKCSSFLSIVRERQAGVNRIGSSYIFILFTELRLSAGVIDRKKREEQFCVTSTCVYSD